MTAAPQTTLSENKGEKILLDGHKHCQTVLKISVFRYSSRLELYLHDWKLLQSKLALKDDYIMVITNLKAQLVLFENMSYIKIAMNKQQMPS